MPDYEKDIPLTPKERSTIAAALLFYKLELDEQKLFTDQDVINDPQWGAAEHSVHGSNAVQGILAKICGKSDTEMEQFTADMVSRDAEKRILFEPNFND